MPVVHLFCLQPWHYGSGHTLVCLQIQRWLECRYACMAPVTRTDLRRRPRHVAANPWLSTAAVVMLSLRRTLQCATAVCPTSTPRQGTSVRWDDAMTFTEKRHTGTDSQLSTGAVGNQEKRTWNSREFTQECTCMARFWFRIVKKSNILWNAGPTICIDLHQRLRANKICANYSIPI